MTGVTGCVIPYKIIIDTITKSLTMNVVGAAQHRLISLQF